MGGAVISLIDLAGPPECGLGEGSVANDGAASPREKFGLFLLFLRLPLSLPLLLLITGSVSSPRISSSSVPSELFPPKGLRNQLRFIVRAFLCWSCKGNERKKPLAVSSIKDTCAKTTTFRPATCPSSLPLRHSLLLVLPLVQQLVVASEAALPLAFLQPAAG